MWGWKERGWTLKLYWWTLKRNKMGRGHNEGVRM